MRLRHKQTQISCDFRDERNSRTPVTLNYNRTHMVEIAVIARVNTWRSGHGVRWTNGLLFPCHRIQQFRCRMPRRRHVILCFKVERKYQWSVCVRPRIRTRRRDKPKQIASDLLPRTTSDFFNLQSTWTVSYIFVSYDRVRSSRGAHVIVVHCHSFFRFVL